MIIDKSGYGQKMPVAVAFFLNLKKVDENGVLVDTGGAGMSSDGFGPASSKCSGPARIRKNISTFDFSTNF